MAKILVNYIYDKANDRYEINKGGYVFADMKVAVLETEEEIGRPLVVPINNILTVVDRDKYEIIHKRFRLVADENGIVTENPNGTEVWLPKDTDVSKLRFINGQLVMIQEEPKKEQEQKETPKAETKPTSKKRKTN